MLVTGTLANKAALPAETIANGRQRNVADVRTDDILEAEGISHIGTRADITETVANYPRQGIRVDLPHEISRYSESRLMPKEFGAAVEPVPGSRTPVTAPVIAPVTASEAE